MDEHTPRDAMEVEDIGAKRYAETAKQPAVDKVKRWSRAELLEWIKEQRLLEDDELEKLRAAGISGKFFLTLAGKPEFFEEKCRLPVGPSGELSNLAEEITGKQALSSPDPLECPREETVSALWERIQKQRVIHVRATPASGKSTLSRLLEEYVERVCPNLPVKWCSWPLGLQELLKANYNNSNAVLRHVFNVPPEQQINWLKWPGLLIIDEAQASYPCADFWNDFIKAITETSAPMVVFFSSWGSAADRSEAKTPTPIYFNPEQRISIRPSHPSEPAVFFTYAEFLDVVERVKAHESKYGQAFLPDGDVVDYIWDLTNGHPGSTRLVLDFLLKSDEIRTFRKTSLRISLDAALIVLSEDSKLVSELLRNRAFRRGLPPREYLQKNPGVVKVFREVLLNHCTEGTWELDGIRVCQVDPAVNTCYWEGWLQAELKPKNNSDESGIQYTVFVFSSVLHRRCLEWMLSTEAPSFPEEFGNVEQLVLESIKLFSPAALNCSERKLASGADLRPVEAMYQDELYRSCYSLLGHIYLSSEWSGKPKRGRVDFLVRQKKWGIECVRDGRNLQEHIDRFQKGGRYYPWIRSGQMTSYILVDFRRSRPKKLQSPCSWLYYVIFSDNYASYEVLNCELDSLGGPICLFNH